jgi:hypothetical protein
VPVKALCDMFIARSAGKKLVVFADTLPMAVLGRGPLRAAWLVPQSA